MGLVHTFVAEVLAHLVNAFKTAYNQTLQVQLCSYTHVHILVQSIEVCHEGTGTGTAGDVLQNRSVNLCIACIVQDATHGADNSGTLQEGFLNTVVYYQVNIALTITEFRIVE